MKIKFKLIINEMKKILICFIFSIIVISINAQEFKIVTTIESVVPGGLGRSRMLQTDENGNTEEIKMNNYFSLAGINFGNVMENDQQISKMLGNMSKEGWELMSIVPGVYSADKSTGIFITRYYFKKNIKIDDGY